MSVFTVIAIVLMVLKLCGIISIGWLSVLGVVVIPWILAILFIFVVAFIEKNIGG